MSSATTLAASTRDSHFIQRIRCWSRSRRELAGFVIDVLCVLVAEGATGCLSINLTRGCAASAEFVERAEIS